MWGLWGGALAGLVDALFASLRLADQISFGRHVQLGALGLALGAWLGLPVALAAWLLSRGAVTLASRLGRPALAALWPAVASAPLLFANALSVFSGPRASRIPAHGVLSVLLGMAGCAAVAVVSLLVNRRLARSRQQASRGVALGCAAALLVLGWTNANVLPRLYPWFHHALALWAIVLGVLCVRAWLVRPPRRRPALVALLMLVLVPTFSAYRSLRVSRQVRFALFDKTAALGVYAGYLPLPRAQRQSRPSVQVAGDEAPSAPLPEGPKRPGADVVLITIDALRHDHVGAYGYQRPTTPHLDRLAREGVRFSRAYTQAPHTSFAVTSMLTGKFYPTLLRLKSGDGGEPITLLLRRYGFKTAAFYPPAVFFVDGEKLAPFRDSHYNFEYVKCEFLSAEGRVDQIMTYFDTVKPDRAFVWVHFFEPHEPYENHPGHVFGKRDLDRYDSEIAYTDAAVGKLLSYLERNRPGAIVIASADHGEEFDDHGGRYHGSSLYEEQVRVPLLMRIPKGAARVVQGQAQLVDVAPTLLALLDIPVPARMRGTDLGPWLSEQGAPAARLPGAFAEVEGKRMVVHDEHKLICDSEAGACQLFDLANDPHEIANLIDEAPERAERLRLRLDRWLDAQGRLEQLGDEASGALPKAIERGRLGDVDAAADLLRLARVPGDEDVRTEAARLLALLPPQPPLREELARAVREPQGEPPQAARWLLVAAAAAGADVLDLVSPIVASAPGGGDPAQPPGELEVMAALVLAERGKGEGTPLLTATLSQCNGTPQCRRTIRALATLGDPSVLPALHATMADDNARLEVVRALGALRNPSSFRVLVQALREDQRVPVRAEAALALARLGGGRAKSVLTEAARREREAPVQAAIEQALTNLGTPRVRSLRP